MLDAFTMDTPTYSWKSIVPTKKSYYYSSKNFGPTTISELSLMQDLAKAMGKTLQQAKLDLVVSVTIGKGGANQPLTVHVSLQDSIISSGKMFWDADDERGFYQDQVDVEMFLSRDGTTPIDDLPRASDAPETVNGSGATSSSVSISFSVSGSANAGFFGGTPTGGVGGGASLGVSNTHSFSKNLSDFKAINNTERYTIRHTYKMAESSGGAYEKAIDLVPKGDDIGFVQAFRKIKLHRPPDLAISNLPLISQAAWQATTSREYDEKIHAVIKVTQRVVHVEGTNNFTSVHSESTGRKLLFTHSEPITLKPFEVKGGDAVTAL